MSCCKMHYGPLLCWKLMSYAGFIELVFESYYKADYASVVDGYFV